MNDLNLTSTIMKKILLEFLNGFNTFNALNPSFFNIRFSSKR